MQGETAELPLAGSTWKQIIVDGLYRTGLLGAFHGFSHLYELRPDVTHGTQFRRVRRAKYVILGYHRVGAGGVPVYCTLPQSVFEKQMQHIARHYRVISVRQMAGELESSDASGQAVVVTFDDGYLGTFTEAFPILQKYNIPATVYLTAGAVDSGEICWYDRIFLQFQKASSELNLVLDTARKYKLTTNASRIEAAAEVIMYLRSRPDNERQDWCRDFDRMLPLRASEVSGAMMSWEQARAMQRAGICFGAHTMTHPVVSRLEPDAVAREVGESKQLIEHEVDAAVEDFAYPFGKVSDCGVDRAQVLQRLGFRTAMTTIVGVNEPGADLFRLRRRVVGNDNSIANFALQLQRSFFHPVDEELLEMASVTTS